MLKTVGHYQYCESDELGRGSFSRVYLGAGVGVGREHDKVAIKVMELPKSDGKTKHLLREIELMRHLKHRNIVRLIDVKYEKYGHTGLRIFIVMEYCSKGDMSSLPRPMSEEDCKHYFRGIFSGLRYLKKRQIVHRDIKPQNILLTENNEVKIADFTFSKQIEENELLQTQCGTPLFISPDVMFGKPYTDKSDLYSCGVMLYSFLYGTHPLGNVKSHVELIQKMKRAKITFPQKLVHEAYELPAKGTKDRVGPMDDDHGDVEKPVFCRTIRIFSTEVLELCKGLLKFNPAERISWDQIYTDPWLNLDPIDPDELFPSPSIVNSPSSANDTGSYDDGDQYEEDTTRHHNHHVHAFSAPSHLSIPRGIIPVPRSSPPPPMSSLKTLRKSAAPSPPIPPAEFTRQQSFEQFKMETSNSDSSIELTRSGTRDGTIKRRPSASGGNFGTIGAGVGEGAEESSRTSTRLILDYYSTSPDGAMFNLPTTESGAKSTSRPHKLGETSSTSSSSSSTAPKRDRTEGVPSISLLSRSIEAIHKVFSL